MTIPPNTNATVVVPGTDLEPVEVGSGRWSWTAAYTDPDARGPFTVDDLLGDILCEEGGLEAITKVLKEMDASPFLRQAMLNQRNSSLRQVLQMAADPKAAAEKMDDALAKIKQQ